MKFGFRGIFPKKKIDPAAYDKAVDEVLKAVAEAMKKEFERTVSTWKQKPQFQIVKKGKNYLVITNDPVYKFVSRGTRVRYAVMSKGFVAKTSPGVMVSGAGAGGAVRINVKKPMPGIKARSFETKIAQKWRKVVPELVQMAIRDINR